MNTYTIKNCFLFGVLGTVALLEIFNTNHILLHSISSPLLIGICVWIICEYLVQRREDKSYFDFWIYTLNVGIISWLVEFIAIHNSDIFGSYYFSDVLQPAIDNVPIAISCIWITALYSSRAVALDIYKGKNRFIVSLLTAFFMVIFDLVMEPAAVNLGYWTWNDLHIPLIIYISWFGISFVFALFGEYFGVFEDKTPPMASSFYWALLLCFLTISVF